MKLAIHNGGSWNAKWREYCVAQKIDFIEVDCYDSDIIRILKEHGITHLMWHFHHVVPKDILMARNVLYSSEKIGVKVFPDFDTCWHFDDKVSQKYLLEALDAPMVKSFAFFDKITAKHFIEGSSFPLVAKLRRGAGSYNVQLIKSKTQAESYISKMFSSGFRPTPGYIADFQNKLKVAGNLEGIFKRLKKAPNFFKMVLLGNKLFPKEKGYVYFQEFIKDNSHDIRVAIVGNHIWAFKRKVRSGDFRASGSGMIEYDDLNIPISVIKELHRLTNKIGAQSIAYDLVVNENNEYLIVEISYGYSGEAIYNCNGYWNENYEFIETKLYPEHVILENFVKS